MTHRWHTALYRAGLTRNALPKNRYYYGEYIPPMDGGSQREQSWVEHLEQIRLIDRLGDIDTAATLGLDLQEKTKSRRTAVEARVYLFASLEVIAGGVECGVETPDIILDRGDDAIKGFRAMRDEFNAAVAMLCKQVVYLALYDQTGWLQYRSEAATLSDLAELTVRAISTKHEWSSHRSALKKVLHRKLCEHIRSGDSTVKQRDEAQDLTHQLHDPYSWHAFHRCMAEHYIKHRQLSAAEPFIVNGTHTWLKLEEPSAYSFYDWLWLFLMAWILQTDGAPQLRRKPPVDFGAIFAARWQRHPVTRVQAKFFQPLQQIGQRLPMTGPRPRIAARDASLKVPELMWF